MASASIDVYVKLPTGKAISLQQWPSESVRDIAKKVAESEKVSETRIRIKYQGKTLDKNKTIAYLGICAETILKAEVNKCLVYFTNNLSNLKKKKNDRKSWNNIFF